MSSDPVVRDSPSEASAVLERPELETAESDTSTAAAEPQETIVLERPEPVAAPETDSIQTSDETQSVVLERVEPIEAEVRPESAAGELTQEAPSIVVERVDSVSTETPVSTDQPTTTPTIPQPVRPLPRRPRIRSSFHFDGDNQRVCEITLMDENRELIHRVHLVAEPGGAISRIFDALLGVASQAALEAGVFGVRQRRSEDE